MSETLNSSPKQLIQQFWQTMQTNDFTKAAQLLSEDYQGLWPQSEELIVGRDHFIAINTTYPAEGKWMFTLKRIVAEGNQVVTEVDITDGSIKATAISFHTVENGLITRQLEYWPVPYAAPAWRKQWVTQSQHFIEP